VLSSGPSTFSPCRSGGSYRDLTAAVGIPARRGVMTGFVASQYIRPPSVRRNYMREGHPRSG
jgi:hypothetical protein